MQLPPWVSSSDGPVCVFIVDSLQENSPTEPEPTEVPEAEPLTSTEQADEMISLQKTSNRILLYGVGLICAISLATFARTK